MKSPALLLCLLGLGALDRVMAAEAPAAGSPAPETFSLETYASVGSRFAANGQLEKLGWDDAQFEAFLAGMRDAFHGKPRPWDARSDALHADIGRRLHEADQADARAAQEYFRDPARLESYMKEVCKALRLDRTDSGLAYSLMSRTGGPRPEPNDTVVLSFSVKAANIKTDLPQLAVRERAFRIAELLPGLAEGVQLMTLDCQAIFLVPPELSFGSKAWPEGVQPGTPLLFNVSLQKIIPPS